MEKKGPENTAPHGTVISLETADLSDPAVLARLRTRSGFKVAWAVRALNGQLVYQINEHTSVFITNSAGWSGSPERSLDLILAPPPDPRDKLIEDLRKFGLHFYYRDTLHANRFAEVNGIALDELLITYERKSYS